MGGRAVNLRSPLAVVLGRGSTGHGVAHWWAQRVTALALVPLTLWFVVSLIGVPLNDYAAVTIWIGASWNPVWFALLLQAECWHSRLGLRHGYPLVAVVALYAVLGIAFGRAP